MLSRDFPAVGEDLSKKVQADRFYNLLTVPPAFFDHDAWSN